MLSSYRLEFYMVWWFQSKCMVTLSLNKHVGTTSRIGTIRLGMEKSMRKKRRLRGGLLAAALALSVFGAKMVPVTAEEAVPDDFREMSGEEMVQEMGAGWNLGNTMDGHFDMTPGETAWQSVETTQELIKSVHDMGFHTLRVPVTWGNMIDDENDYAIDEAWMQRVKEIVDYGINEGMYVIINIHHDGADSAYWLNTVEEDMEPVYEKFGGVWKNIAMTFRDYDEHLIFESMNEVYGGEEEISKLNQAFVDAVRATGHNNAKRWLSIPGSGANIGSATMDFPFPEDTIENRQFFAVHYYDGPFSLTETMDVTEWTEGDTSHLYQQLRYLKKFFTKKGIPVILGEYGCIDKNNTAERAYFDEVTTRMCKNMGVVPVYWDNGYHDETKSPDYGFSLINRETGEPWYPEIVQAIMRGIYLDGTYQEVVKNPTIIQAESIEPSQKKLTLEAGEQAEVDIIVSPEDSNDVVLWKSQDESVATVFSGKVHAVADGATEIIAFSQSGSVQEKITVQVGEVISAEGAETEKSSKSIPITLIVIGVGTICMAGLGILKDRRKSN